MTKTQRYTIQTNANNLVIPGAVFTAVGGAMSICGIVLMSIGQTTTTTTTETGSSSETSDWTGPGAILLGMGGAILIPGLIMLPIGLKKRKKMEQDKLAFDINTKHCKLTLEPAFAAGENGGVFGLSGRF